MPRAKRLADLTDREREALSLIRLGLTNEQIAERLNITLAGAKYHVSEILTKLGVASREEAAAWQPEPRQSRWAAWPVLGKIALVGAAAIVLAALALLALEVLRTDHGNDATTSASPSASVTATPQLVSLDSAQSVYFFRQDGDIYTVPAGGGALTKFAEGDQCTAGTLSNTWKLDWSPHGDLLACTGTVSNTAVQIVLYDRSGNIAAQAQVSPLPTLGCGPQWSPDGRWITYRWLPDQSKIETMTVLDTALAVHAQLPSTDIALPPFVASGRPWPCWPAWSLDGSRIAYLDMGSEQVRVYSLDTGQNTVVITGDYKPLAWKSGDQVYVAQDFSTNEGGFQTYKISLLDVATGSIERMPGPDSGPGSPEEGINRQGWVSPDGRYVALLSRQTGSDLQGIGVYDTDTGQFTIIPQSNVTYPSEYIPPSYIWFSADSSQVLWWDESAGVFSSPSGGGAGTSVAPLHAPGISPAPIYSPDLKSAVHLEFGASGKQLILSKPDGTGDVELSSLLMATGQSGSVVAWNPDY
jgi:DNA-binding CsgD family transcriptional regulator